MNNGFNPENDIELLGGCSEKFRSCVLIDMDAQYKKNQCESLQYQIIENRLSTNPNHIKDPILAICPVAYHHFCSKARLISER